MTDLPARIEVPEEFRRLGFSGEFWLNAEVDPGFPGEAPCLLGNKGWLLLSREGTRGVLVRNDAGAIVDTVRLAP